MSFINTILDVIFPVNCVSCGKPSEELCAICLRKFPENKNNNSDWIFSLFEYQYPSVKKSIWFLKYKNKKRLAKTFAELLYTKIVRELSSLPEQEKFSNPLLMPIPISAKRRRERGYNQTELLCQELLKLDRERILSLEKTVLIKPKETEHQAQIKNKQERLQNIVGTYSLKNREKIKDRNIILIDDVTTTGATLEEAKKLLKKFEAKKIIAFTIAH
ncbi:MAG TPA: phosphoribosyltransferase family protein [Candidatus Paceibacterota bacterium]|nr:phosphoribosyltransferase family protein [Candidatus Paceibacterota bacterium]